MEGSGCLLFTPNLIHLQARVFKLARRGLPLRCPQRRGVGVHHQGAVVGATVGGLSDVWGGIKWFFGNVGPVAAFVAIDIARGGSSGAFAALEGAAGGAALRAGVQSLTGGGSFFPVFWSDFNASSWALAGPLRPEHNKQNDRKDRQVE